MYHLGEIKGEIITYIIQSNILPWYFLKYSDNILTFANYSESIFTVNLQLSNPFEIINN